MQLTNRKTIPIVKMLMPKRTREQDQAAAIDRLHQATARAVRHLTLDPDGVLKETGKAVRALEEYFIPPGVSLKRRR